MHFSARGFTLVEIMTVMTIISILASGLFIGVQPYMMRSRDTKRITSLQSYMANILMTYERNFDTFPSNYGKGGNFNALGYCLSEVVNRSNDVVTPTMNISKSEGHFSALRTETTIPPVDPSSQLTYEPLCDQTGSYIYSQIKFGTNKQLALVAAKLEIRESANYGTGADLIDPAAIPNLYKAKKSTIPVGAPDRFFILTGLSE